MDCSPPGSSVLGILQARTLEWVAISSSRESSLPRDWTRIYLHLLLWQADSLLLGHQGSSNIFYLQDIGPFPCLSSWKHPAGHASFGSQLAFHSRTASLPEISTLVEVASFRMWGVKTEKDRERTLSFYSIFCSLICFLNENVYLVQVRIRNTSIGLSVLYSKPPPFSTSSVPALVQAFSSSLLNVCCKCSLSFPAASSVPWCIL